MSRRCRSTSTCAPGAAASGCSAGIGTAAICCCTAPQGNSVRSCAAEAMLALEGQDRAQVQTRGGRRALLAVASCDICLCLLRVSVPWHYIC